MEDQPWSRRRLLGALGTAVAGGLAGCTFASPRSETETATPGSVDGTAEPAQSQADIRPDAETGTRRLDDGTSAVDSTFSRVYQQVVDSVVAVRVSQSGGTSRGTAWVYDEDHLVTNEHVVSDADTVSVWFDDIGWQAADVVGTDVYSDLGVLNVTDRPEDATPLPTVERDPPIGADVAAIGNPFGLSGSLATGVVSGRNRTLPAPNGFSIPDAVQTDAPVNPGNSGGPLVDIDGEVVGVINSGGGDNIGFAISAAMVQRVVPALIEDGDYDHSYMGISIREVTPSIVEAMDLPVSRGLYVHDVVDGGPSEGTLQGSTGTEFVDGRSVDVGGDVIVRMGRTEIRTSQTLSTFLALAARPGDVVEVEVIRDGRRQTVLVELGSRPDP